MNTSLKPLFLSAALLLVLACCVEAQSVSKSPNARKPPTFDLERAGVVEFSKPDENGIYDTTVSIGKIPAGQQVKINLVLKNLSDEEIKFSRPAKKCKCSQFTSTRDFIPAKDQTEASVILKIPARGKAIKANSEVTLESRKSDRSKMNIKIEYELAGLLVFGRALGVLSFDDESPQKKHIDFPLLASLPVDLNKIDVRASENLSSAEFAIAVDSENEGTLRVTIDQSLIAGGSIQGEISISDPENDRRDICYLSIKDQRQSEISPRIISFKTKDQGLMATAIIRLAKLGGDSDESADAKIECSWQGQPLQVTSRKLGTDIVRVELTADQALAASLTKSAAEQKEQQFQLDWQIEKNGKTTQIKTPLVLGQ